MSKRILFMIMIMASVLPDAAFARSGDKSFPAILSIRDQTNLVREITKKRLDQLLPQFMRQTGFDMWIIACNEDHLRPGLPDDDPLQTLVPHHPDPGLLRPGPR